MKNSVTFNKILIAPCGMNCGTCLAYLREKNKCPGCRDKSSYKAVSVMSCIIPRCENLARTTSGFCYDCAKFPCKRVKQLDKRYSLKYRTSFIENLTIIKEKGMNSFLQFESKRRTCKSCGSVLSVHRDNCLVCKRSHITKN
jgi:hypothetical protein